MNRLSIMLQVLIEERQLGVLRAPPRADWAEYLWRTIPWRGQYMLLRLSQEKAGPSPWEEEHSRQVIARKGAKRAPNYRRPSRESIEIPL